MSPDLVNQLNFWFAAAGIFGGIVGATSAVITWWYAHTLVSKKEFSKFQIDHDGVHADLDRRLDDGSGKFTSLEGDLRHRPGMTDLGELHEAIAALKVEVARLTENRQHVGERISDLSDSIGRRLDNTEEAVARIGDFLLKERGG